jgi:type IV pilus assembly protein PilM
VVRQLDLPYLPEEQLRESLQFQVQDAIPIPIDEAILDFSVLENYETQEGESYSRILLVAAQRDAVSTVTDTVGKAKLAPRSLDLDALALLRSLAPESWIEEAGGGEAIVDVGSSVTNVVVHQDRIPAFVRIVVMGGQGITEALSQSLGVSFDEAEELKATGSEEQEALGTETNRVIDEKLDRFCEEIRGSLDFYASQETAVPIQRVVVTGGGSRLRYLPERLAQVLGLPVVSGHPMQGLKIGDVGLSHQELVDAEPYLSVAIGLAMEDS